MGLIPTNRAEAVQFWKANIQLFHPDDDPADCVNVATGENETAHLHEAWKRAWELVDPWSLDWNQFDFNKVEVLEWFMGHRPEPHDSRSNGPVFCAVCGDVEIDDALVPLGVRTCHDCEVLRPAECAEVSA